MLRLVCILTLVFVSLPSWAQFRIDSVRIIKTNIQYQIYGDHHSAIPTYPEDTVTIVIQSFSTVSESDNRTHYYGFGYDSISFSFDSANNHLFNLRHRVFPRDGSETVETIDNATIYRMGNDYRVYLKGNELSASGYIYSSSKTIYWLNQKLSGYINFGGPTDSSSIEFIFYGSMPLDVQSVDHKSNFSVYPNPSSHFITVDVKAENSNIEIWDMLGRRALMEVLNRTPNELVADVSKLQPGFYWLRVGSHTEKIIIER